MRLIIDAMGGDLAPQAPVAGALQAIQTYGCQVILVGQEEVIRQTLAKEGVTNLPDGLTIHNATQVIEICDNPSTAWRRKKDSSLTVGMNLLMAGEGDAFLSAGSTGAILTGATFLVKRIPGIRRAAVAPVIPTAKGQAILIDAGANAECTPEYFLQFACMGSFYAHKLLGLENPKVGLLNIGAEPSKGSEHYKTVHQLLQKASDAGRINFIGNVEGKHVILLDDMVDTAGSLCGAAKALIEIGHANSVVACASHGVLSGPALQRIEDSMLEEVVFLDTIPQPARLKSDKIHYISVAKVFAEAISRIYHDTSMSAMFR